MKYFLLIINILVSVCIYSQPINLVPNGNFEFRRLDDSRCISGSLFCSSCPNSSFEATSGCCCCERDLIIHSQFAGGQSIIPFVVGWKAMNSHAGSCDYFNACARAEEAGVPINQLGTQNANSGQAYMGIIARSTNNIPGAPIGESTEYLQIELATPLITGNFYRATMNVSLAESSKFACAGLSMLLTQNQPSPTLVGNTGIVSGFTPQIVSNLVISDKDNWVEISGIFQANGNEKFLTIGIFDQLLSNPVSVSPSSSKNSAYYYIDDVSVSDINQECCPPFVIFENEDFLPKITFAQDFIRAGNNVTVQAPPNVSFPQDVTFSAGNDIFLEPGFTVEPGAKFLATIGGCDKSDDFPNPEITSLPNVVSCIEGYCFRGENITRYEFEAFRFIGGTKVFSEIIDVNTPTSKYCPWDFAGQNIGQYQVQITAFNCEGEEVFDHQNVFFGCANSSAQSNFNHNLISEQFVKDSMEYISVDSTFTIVDELKFKAIPNPNSGSFFITSDNNESITRIEGYNSFGELFFVKTNLNKTSVSINKNFTSGMYFVKVWSGEQSAYIKVMVD